MPYGRLGPAGPTPVTHLVIPGLKQNLGPAYRTENTEEECAVRSWQFQVFIVKGA